MGVLKAMSGGGHRWTGSFHRQPKKDCRFYDAAEGECVALKCLYCAYERKICNFYKPKEENE